MNSPKESGIVTYTSFFLLSFFFFFCTPIIEINGEKHKRGWGRHFFKLPAGEYKVKIYFAYMWLPKCGENEVDLKIEEDEVKKVSFFMPSWVYAKGSIKVKNV